jgi:hypothetical protein
MCDAILFDQRHTDTDISKFEVELILFIATAIRIGCDNRVCLNYLFDFTVDEVIEGVYVLFNKPP